MYWPLLHTYSENFGFGAGFSIIRGTFNKRMKGLCVCMYRCTTINTNTDINTSV